MLVKDLRPTAVHHEPEVVEHPVEKETIRINVIGKIDLNPPKKHAPPPPPPPPAKKEKEKEKAEVPPPPPPPPPVVHEAPETEVKKEEPVIPVEEAPKDIVPEPKHEIVPEPPQEVIPAKPGENFYKQEIKDVEVKVVGKIDLDAMNQRTRPPKKTREQLEVERRTRTSNQQRETAERTQPQDLEVKPRTGGRLPEVIKARAEKLAGPTVVGKMNLEPAGADKDDSAEKKKRKRIKKDTQRVSVEKPATDG